MILLQERHEAKTVREMKEFVEKLPYMQVGQSIFKRFCDLFNSNSYY